MALIGVRRALIKPKRIVSGGGGGFSITPLTHQTINNNATPTFSPVTYGSVPLVLFAVNFGPPGTAVSISALSLNGVAGSAVGSAFADNHNQGSCSDIWAVAAPGGTSGALSITFSGPLSNGVFVKSYAIQTANPAALTGANNTAAGVAAPTASINTLAIPAGGGLIAIAGGFNTNALTFTGLTQDDNPSWSGQFVTVEGESGNTTTGAGSTPTLTANSAGSENWAFSAVAIGP